MKNILVTLVFMAAVMAAGFAIGIGNPPGEWYAALEKPAFTPAPLVFPVAWSLLYAMIGAAGARLALFHRRSVAMRLWCVQLLFNFAWSPLFFGLHEVALALIVILALLVSILLLIAKAWPIDRIVAGLFLPYAAWVAFASLLNGAILALN